MRISKELFTLQSRAARDHMLVRGIAKKLRLPPDLVREEIGKLRSAKDPRTRRYLEIANLNGEYFN